MPIGQNQEARNRYLQAVEVRDRNPQLPFTSMATLLGYQRASNARHAWIQGLRLLGRESEIPAQRQVRVSVGRGEVTINIDDLEGFVPAGDYTFGVEIETVALTRTACASALMDNGIQAYDEDYNHNTRSHWKVVRDGSLSHRSGSAEVVSPILRGADGASELRSVMKVLREAGAKTNSSCGMHIHIGVSHLHPQVQANIIRQHSVWNVAFDALILERRINNTYAQKRNFNSAEQMATAWVRGLDANNDTSRRVSDRYKTLNVASYHKYGTFEFRMHHGSLNGKSASAWVALHTAFCEAVARGQLDATPESMIAMLTDDQIGAQMLTGNYSPEQAVAIANIREAFVRNVRNGLSVPRGISVILLRTLVSQLRLLGLLSEECAQYLSDRAGNLPATASARNV